MNTARFITPLLIAAAAAGLDAQQAQPAPQQPVFRSALDVVTIDVSVRSGRAPVGGLTAQDFVLLDNGVRQAIESIEMESVAIDVTVIADANEDVAPGARSLGSQIAEIAGLLRGGDRLRVMKAAGFVADLVRAQDPAVLRRSPPEITPAALSVAHDAISAALLRPVEPSRRHIVIAVTNGIDAMSAIDAATVRAIARHSPAVLHVVQVDVGLEGSEPPLRYTTGRERLELARCQASGVCAPTRNFWRPYDDKRDLAVLREAAESTGGAMHLPGLFSGAVSVFRGVFEDYRRSYLLRYTPQGVAREGWHEVTVTVPRHAYTVHARRGYAIETAPAPAVKPSGASLAAATLASVTGAYSLGDYARFEAEVSRLPNLASFIGDFRKAGNPWPASPTKEAAFVIEIAEAALRSRRANAVDAAHQLLVEHAKLVRHPLGPDQFEKYWLWSLIASLQGVSQPAMTREFIDYALTRFPEEPRFVLARALAADQARAFEPVEGRGGAGDAAHVREVTARYDAAARFDDTAAEAGLRKGLFLHRIGRHREALEALGQVTPAQIERDLFLTYLFPLVRGRVLEALEKLDEAKAAYQAAAAALPDAQSPRVALMRLLMRTGDRPAAEALAAAIQTASDDAVDPWWLYWLGDYRHYDAILGRLRDRTQP